MGFIEELDKVLSEAREISEKSLSKYVWNSIFVFSPFKSFNQLRRIDS